jgi:hypothetical protein
MMIQSATTNLYNRAFAGAATAPQAAPAVANSREVLKTLAENPGNQRQAALVLIMNSLQPPPEPVRPDPARYQSSLPNAVPAPVATSYTQSPAATHSLDLYA